MMYEKHRAESPGHAGCFFVSAAQVALPGRHPHLPQTCLYWQQSQIATPIFCANQECLGSEQAECGGLHRAREKDQGYLEDVSVGAALVGLTVFCVLQEHAVHVRAGILKEAVGAVEDDEGDLTVTEHAQLIGLLHQPELALGKCHLDPGTTGGVGKDKDLGWCGGVGEA